MPMKNVENFPTRLWTIWCVYNLNGGDVSNKADNGFERPGISKLCRRDHAQLQKPRRSTRNAGDHLS